MFELRDYQTEAVDSFFDAAKKGSKSGVISVYTGGGKSLIIAEIIRRMRTQWSNTHIVVATHRKELIQQDKDELSRLCPDIKSGIYSAGIGEKNLSCPVTFTGVQTAYKHGLEFGKIDLLIVDEAHLIPQADTSQYQQFIHSLSISNPHIVILGLTATPMRMDSGLIYGQEDSLFETLYYDIGVCDLIERKYLCPVVSKGAIGQKIDLTGVHTVAGDYNKQELEFAANQTELTRSAVSEIIDCGCERRAWLIFTTGINHAEAVKDEFERQGIKAGIVHSKMDEDRDSVISDYKSGKLNCLINVDVLTTGFNAPRTDLIALMMSTKSVVKYLQIVGRGLRLCEGKTNCLLLDFGSNVERLGLIDDPETIKPKVKGKGNGDAPVKECPNCHEYCHPSKKFCPECGYKFEEKPKHDSHAYSGDVLSNNEPIWVNVEGMVASRNAGKNGKLDTLRIDIMTDNRFEPYPIWLCLEHPEGSFPRKKANELMQALGGSSAGIDDAIKGQALWRLPTRIQVKKDGKFWRVLKYDFDDENNPLPHRPTLTEKLNLIDYL